jgi:uncharacterized protein YjeT (DUF2065 family)
MNSTFQTVAFAMGLGRIALGLAPFVAARPASRLVGFPASHDSPTARLMGRLFGVRDIGLGVLVFYALLHPLVAPFIFLFNATMDGGDVISVAIPLVKREGIDRGATVSGIMATLGGLGWVVMWCFT